MMLISLCAVHVGIILQMKQRKENIQVDGLTLRGNKSYLYWTKNNNIDAHCFVFVMVLCLSWFGLV